MNDRDGEKVPLREMWVKKAFGQRVDDERSLGTDVWSKA